MDNPKVEAKPRLAYKHQVAIVYILGLFMEIMDTTIVNVAIPTLSERFSASPSHIELTIIAYLLSLVVFIPASGWLGDRFGTRRLFLVALNLFVAASALCGLAQSLNQLIAFRALQGVGGGLLTPVGATMLYRAFPQHERAKAATAVFGVAVLAPAIGPVVGGVLVDSVSWRWIFLVNVPIGIATSVYAAAVLREHKEAYAKQFDYVGFVLAGLTAAGIVLSVALGPTSGWGSPEVLLTALVTALLGWMLVRQEAAHPSPMLHLRLLKDRMFRIGNLVAGFVTSGYLGLIFLMPSFLQTVHGLSARDSGLVLLPQSIGGLIGSQIAGRFLYQRIGPRPLLAAGAAVAGMAGLAIASVGRDVSPLVIGLLLFVRGLAIGPVFISLQTATFASIAAVDTGQALAIYSTQRQLSAAIGAVVGAAWLTMRASGEFHSEFVAYRESFAVVSAILLVGAAVSLFVRSDDARSTFGEGAPASLDVSAAKPS